MDLAFLGEIQRYDKGYIKETIGNVDIENEIEKISKEMDDINIKALRFDRWDFFAIFGIALLEIGTDFLLGDPKKGISSEISNKNTKLGEYFNNLHENVDHKGNSLDYQGYKFGGGDHRGRTFGHDMFSFPLAIYSLCNGQFIDGYYQDGRFNWVYSKLNQYGSEYVGLPPDQAIMAYLSHMFADFFSSKSLPVPGFGVLAHMPSRDIRVMVNKMYADGFNLRHMLVQGVPVVVAEILVRLFFYFRNRSVDADDAAKKHKLNKMLLMTHTLAALVNIGKVYFTNNPTAINLPMLLRVIWLTWSVLREEMEVSHRAKIKINYGVIKNKYETMQTLVMLDQAIYYTREIDKFIVRKNDEFVIAFDDNEKDIESGFGEIDDLMAEFANFNRSF